MNYSEPVQQVGDLVIKKSMLGKTFCLAKRASFTFLFGIVALPSLVHGQVDDSMTFVVSEFNIQGSNPIGKSANKVLEPFLNRKIDLASLNEAALGLQAEMTRHGFNFYRATVPAQVLGSGSVILNIEKVEIGEISVFGNKHFSSKNIKRSLPLLVSGKSPNTQEVASSLLLAEDNPAKDIRVIFVKGIKPKTVDANIGVTDKNPNEFSVWSNNAGSKNNSRARLGFQYHNRNLWGRDHQVSLSYTTAPQNTSELSQYGLSYKIPFYRFGGVGSFFYSRSDADNGRIADAFDVSGAGESKGFGYTQLLRKMGGYEHRLSFNFADKLFDSDILFDLQNIGTDVRSRPFSIEYISRYERAKSALSSSVSWATNVSGGSFNDDLSYNQSRLGATTDWSKVNLNLRFDHLWNSDWSSRISAIGQFSSDSLISGEQFGLGGGFGSSGPRGFKEREVSTDKGYGLSLETSRSFANGRFRLGAFVDYATGEQNSIQIGENRKESLSSVGVSLDWSIRDNISLSADYGYVLDGIERIDGIESNASDDGDSRVHLSLRYFPKLPFDSFTGGVK